jgi:hypothetical protein
VGSNAGDTMFDIVLGSYGEEVGDDAGDAADAVVDG